MLKITRNDKRELTVSAETGFDSEKNSWMDGIYVLLSNANISIWFNAETEKQLKDFLCKEEDI